MAKKLQISKRSNVKGEDGYKVFSVRIKDETVERLEQIAKETNRSRNELINMMLEFGIENCEITDPKEQAKIEYSKSPAQRCRGFALSNNKFVYFVHGIIDKERCANI